jgi:hypothetical protein
MRRSKFYVGDIYIYIYIFSFVKIHVKVYLYRYSEHKDSLYLITHLRIRDVQAYTFPSI